MKYANVILPLPLETFTYSIPEEMENTVKEGCRVLINFGKKKYYTAIVVSVHENKPKYDTKEIHSLLDNEPVLRRPQLRFWEWISYYYLCKTGDVYNAALPSGLKPEGDTSNVYKKKGYMPKMQTCVRLSEKFGKDKLEEGFELLKRAPLQEALLLRFLDLTHALTHGRQKEISKKDLLELSSSTPAALEGLIKKGVLEYYEKEISRLQPPRYALQPLNELSEAQKKAYKEIHEVFRSQDVCLLHGVTSSGKTEIYSHLIADVMKLGRQALFLLPEIAITTQITERLSKLFGDKLLVYHSKFSDYERVEVWKRLLATKTPVLVLGVRSAILLPFNDLGLIIVDEEHENTYKQQDSDPRYNARNAAAVLARMHGGKMLLGSATPSVDSYYNAISGKYGLVELLTRHGECIMPEIQIADIKELRRKKIMKDTLFSPQLVNAVQAALSKGEQVILFQNRRGFAPLMECESCGWIPHCPNCNVSLTYHRTFHRMECHYCGHVEYVASQCPQCRGESLKMMGFGTEKIEEEVERLFPSAKIDRLDLDSAKTRSAYESIINDFEKGRTNILIGTQMLSKGLDFANVTVVGILNADTLLNHPDFRAHERAFQLMTQVSGRAGRREKPGTVILQTSQPNLPLIRLVEQSDYKEMVRLQLGERKLFHYPPYFRLIEIIFRSKHEEYVQALALEYSLQLRKRFGERVSDPVAPIVNRVQNMYIRKILLRIEVAAAIAPVRAIIEDTGVKLKMHPNYKQVRVHYNVDPV